VNVNHVRPMLAFCALALLAAVITTLGLLGGGSAPPVAGPAPSVPVASSRPAAPGSVGPLPAGLMTDSSAMSGSGTWTALIAARSAVPAPTEPAVATSPATAARTGTATPAAVRVPSHSSPAPAPKPRRHRQPRPAPTPTVTATTTATAPSHGNGHGKGHGATKAANIVVSAPTHHGKGHHGH